MNARTAQEIRFICTRFFGARYSKSYYRRAKEEYNRQPWNEKNEVGAVRQVQHEVTLSRVGAEKKERKRRRKMGGFK